MTIELFLSEIPEGIEHAQASISIDDSSEADAPTHQLYSMDFAPFIDRDKQPNISIKIKCNLPREIVELSLFARIEIKTKHNKTFKFFNTTSTLLSGNPDELVKVQLERIV